MREAQAFIEQILAYPDDESVRLVYADWLDEHGEPDRAEFIRIQCELATRPEHDLSRRILAARETALLEAHRDAWLRPLQEAFAANSRLAARESALIGWLGRGRRLLGRPRPSQPERENRVDSWHFRRGFVGAVVVRVGDPRAIARQLEAIFRLAPLRELNVGISHPNALAHLPVPAFERLRALRLHGSRMRGTELRWLVGASHLTGLDELSLGWMDLAPAAMRLLVESPLMARLRRLAIDQFVSLGQALTPESIRVLAEAPASAGLAELDLTRCGLNGLAVRHLAESPHLAQLVTLNLSENPLDDSAVLALAESPHLRGLRRLDLRHTGLGDRAALILASSPLLSTLAELRLRGNSFSGVAVLALAESPYLSKSARLCL